jgi:hypothetical protein
MLNRQIGKVMTLLTAAAVWTLTSTTANAVLTINDPGVVGTVKGLAGDTGPQEAGFAQHLLDLPANTVNESYAIAPNPAHIYNTSSTDYTGTIIGPGVQGAAGDYTVDAGWQYALAKYDGKNGGYVLFCLNGAATTLPQYSYSIWGDNPEQFAISHYTTFNPVPEPTTLIAGALLLLPFGVSTARMLRNRRSI